MFTRIYSLLNSVLGRTFSPRSPLSLGPGTQRHILFVIQCCNFLADAGWSAAPFYLSTTNTKDLLQVNRELFLKLTTRVRLYPKPKYNTRFLFFRIPRRLESTMTSRHRGLVMAQALFFQYDLTVAVAERFT